MDDRFEDASPTRPVRPATSSGSWSGAPRGGLNLAAAVEEAERRSRRRAMAVAIALAAILAVAGAGVAFWLASSGGQQDAGAYYDIDARTGQAPWKSQEEMQAELDRVVEEGMFDIAIAATIEFPSAGGEGIALIENVQGNRYDMRVSIALDGTGEEVYRSGLIAPGSYIQSIDLTRDLVPGSHEATATFEAVDAETHEAVGKAAAKVELVVKDG